jgi:hypothetical protein
MFEHGRRRKHMHTTVRIYRSAPDLADTLASRVSEISELMKGTPGFEAYQLIKTSGGAVSITTCRDQAGTDESTRIAAEWIRANLPGVVSTPPEVLQGEAVITFGLATAGV